jgi:transposase
MQKGRARHEVAADLIALTKFLKKPRTNQEIAEAFDITRETVGVWFRRLEERGITITRANDFHRPALYVLKDA